MSGAGDINGDGFADLLIGAPEAGINCHNVSGETYVVFGGSHLGTSGSLALSSLDGSNGFSIIGINHRDYSGYAVSGAGDVNGDGVADLFIGAPNASENGGNDAGESYVVFGTSDLGAGGSHDLNALTIGSLSNTTTINMRVTDAADVSGSEASQLITIDTISPTISSLNASTGDGIYGLAAEIYLELPLSEVVVVDTSKGVPTLALNSSVSSVASYISGSGTNTLTFRYTVQSGDSTEDLDQLSSSALALNGSTIRDVAGNDANLNLAEPGAEGSLGAHSNIEIDTIPTLEFSSSGTTVYEGSAFSVGIKITNLAVDTSLYWSLSGQGIDSDDFRDGLTSGQGAVGSDSRFSFTRHLEVDKVLEGDETLEVKIFTDAYYELQVGPTLELILKDPYEGDYPTDGADLTIGSDWDDMLCGIPDFSSLRGLGTVDMLTGMEGNDTFIIGDSLGAYYMDGDPTSSGSRDLVWITDFSDGDLIQLYGHESHYLLASGRYSGHRGTVIYMPNLLGLSRPMRDDEIIAFLQEVRLSSVELSNPNQFYYIN